MQRFGFPEDLLLEGLVFYCDGHNGANNHICLYPSQYGTIFIAHGLELLLKRFLERKCGHSVKKLSLFDTINKIEKEYPAINTFQSIHEIRKYSNNLKHFNVKPYKFRKYFRGALDTIAQIYTIEYPKREAFVNKIIEYRDKI